MKSFREKWEFFVISDNHFVKPWSDGCLMSGTQVFGCRPVLVVFEDFKDREEVLANSK